MAKYENESDRKTNGISELFKTNGISDLNTWKYNKFDDSLQRTSSIIKHYW